MVETNYKEGEKWIPFIKRVQKEQHICSFSDAMKMASQIKKKCGASCPIPSGGRTRSKGRSVRRRKNSKTSKRRTRGGKR